MTSLFISYSRKDTEFARRLTECFKGQDLDFWIDWEGIPPTVDWWREIEKGIEQAGVFLFLISPDSCRSKICRQEIEHAAKNGKRLIPIVVHDVNGEEAPSELRALNWIFLREIDEFDAGVNKLITAIRTDYDWVQTQLQLQTKALEWDRNVREKAFLLHGKELQEAELQLAANSSKEPHPTDLQREYVYASRKAADRQRRNMIGISISAMIIFAALAAYGLIQAGNATTNAQVAQAESTRAFINAATAQAASTLALNNAGTAQANAREAQKQARISRSRELATLSTALREKDFLSSLLLGVEAFHASDTIQARTALMENFFMYPTLQSQLRLQTEPISSTAFSPNGRMLASGNSEGLIVWDVASAQPIYTWIGGETPPINSTAFSPDGKKLAAGGEGITIWDLETGQPFQQLGAGLPVKTVAFSPDGSTLVSVGEQILLWDLAANRPARELMETAGTVLCVASSPDGKTLATGTSSGIHLWDLSTGKQIQQLGQGTAINSIRFRPDGKTLASAGDDLVLWDLEKGEPIIESKSFDYVGSLSFSPDGQKLAAGGFHNTIQFWDVETGRQSGEPLSGPIPETVTETAVKGITFSPDGRTLAAGYWDTSIILWDLGAENQIKRQLWEEIGDINVSLFHPDGKTLITGGDMVVAWDLAAGKGIPLPLEDMTGRINSMAISPDGKFLAIDHCARQTSSGACVQAEIHLWDMATHEYTGPPFRGHKDYILHMAFSPDGKMLASNSIDGTVILWNVETRKPMETLEADGMNSLPGPRQVIFSPDGKILAIGGHEITLWDVDNHRQIGQPLVDPSLSVGDFRFSPDGTMLAAVSGEGWDINLWNVKTGQPVGQPLTWDIGLVAGIAFRPDGKALVSSHTDGSIVLWDLRTGQQIGQPLGGQDSTRGVPLFSPDGNILALVQKTNSIILWDMDPASWIQKTCQRAGRNFGRNEWERFFQEEEIRATCPKWPLAPEITPVGRSI
jgi:WD40 repeat protein